MVVVVVEGPKRRTNGLGWVYVSVTRNFVQNYYTTYSSIRFSSRKHQHERWLGQSFRLVIISADPVFPPLILFQTKNENWEAINSSSFPQKNYAPVWPTCSHNGTALSRRGRHIVISRAGWAGPVTVSRVPPGRCRGRHMDRPQETQATRLPPLLSLRSRRAIGRPANRSSSSARLPPQSQPWPAPAAGRWLGLPWSVVARR